MTVYLMKSLQKIPYIHRVYMVLANPTYMYTNMIVCLKISANRTAYE